jgi:regulator of cell morphogenesis and NO signaling
MFMATLLSSDMALQVSDLSFRDEADTTDKQLYLSAEKWPLPYLVDYILHNHHFYINDALPRIMALLEKVVTEYGLAHPELEQLHHTFHSLARHLIRQMRKEEIILFPYIHILAKPKDRSREFACCSGASLGILLQEIEEEHLLIEQGLADMRRLTKDFTLPPHVCNSYDLLLQWLQKFEKDIYQHEYLENHILFPKVISLEETIGHKPGL